MAAEMVDEERRTLERKLARMGGMSESADRVELLARLTFEALDKRDELSDDPSDYIVDEAAEFAAKIISRAVANDRRMDQLAAQRLCGFSGCDYGEPVSVDGIRVRACRRGCGGTMTV